jgi:hypothetical protein
MLADKRTFINEKDWWLVHETALACDNCLPDVVLPLR